MKCLRSIWSALLLSAFTSALPQAVIDTASATNEAPVSTTVAAAPSSFLTTTSPTSTATGITSGTVSGFTSRSATFVGWSAGYATRSGTTRYYSEYCSRSSIYVESERDGTTYAGCCDTRTGGAAACSTKELAMYCVNNVQMAGNKTISDCGTSTCAYAVIYQNVGDEDKVLGRNPIQFNVCSYYGSRGGTYYRTLPSTNATTRAFTTGSSSSSSSRNSDDGWRPQRVGVAVAGAVIAFLICFVVVPVCILKAMRKNRSPAAGSSSGTYRSSPPTVTAPPAYQRGGGDAPPSTLDPGRSTGPGWAGAFGQHAPKPNEGSEMTDVPPRYEDIGGTRIVR